MQIHRSDFSRARSPVVLQCTEESRPRSYGRESPTASELFGLPSRAGCGKGTRPSTKPLQQVQSVYILISIPCILINAVQLKLNDSKIISSSLWQELPNICNHCCGVECRVGWICRDMTLAQVDRISTVVRSASFYRNPLRSTYRCRASMEHTNEFRFTLMLPPMMGDSTVRTSITHSCLRFAPLSAVAYPRVQGRRNGHH